MLPPLVGSIFTLLAAAGSAGHDPPSLSLSRIQSPIRIDADLSEPAWDSATRIDGFFETNQTDNETPPAKTTAWLAYDDRFFYVAFRCEDTDPRRIRAPFVDRDQVKADQDFAGILLDTRDDRRSALEFYVNPRGIQADLVYNDATGKEDASPDFFWASAARITSNGWNLEMRIPFSSLRYSNKDPQSWGIILYRNYPRGFLYGMTQVRIPRGFGCYVCYEMELTGIRGLPPGSHLVAAPYATAQKKSGVRDESGASFREEPIRGDGGMDVKWTPSPDAALDATIHPDFSQIEADVSQISVNQRFALFFPEKRPFFLEGVDLFDTSIPAVYTRTITSPRWGARVTGKFGATAYTLLVTQDEGGGSVVLPGPQSSRLVPQDFSSIATIGRVRQDIGASFAGLLVTDRESSEGAFNRVVGPDFQWRPGEKDQVSGQLLSSFARAPNRPELAAEWDGRSLNGAAGSLSWAHSSRTWSWRTAYEDVTDSFRADAGFVPQVGFQQGTQFLGYSFWPKSSFFSLVEPVFLLDESFDRTHRTLNRHVFPGVRFRGKGNSSGELDYYSDAVRVGDRLFEREGLAYSVFFSPSLLLPRIKLDGSLGEQIDFVNGRTGWGGDVTLQTVARPTDHLALQFDGERQWLDVSSDSGRRGRLFTATVARLKATYVFSTRSFLRAIGQYVETRHDPSLYRSPVPRREGSFQGSALIGYRLNWQSVVFLGYGDDRTLQESGDLARGDRQFFLKMSYAIQI